MSVHSVIYHYKPDIMALNVSLTSAKDLNCPQWTSQNPRDSSAEFRCLTAHMTVAFAPQPVTAAPCQSCLHFWCGETSMSCTGKL